MWGLGVYGPDQDPPEKLDRPHGICANRNGDVYVADTGNHRIVQLYNPGNKLEFVGAIGDSGDAPGLFNYPRQVAMDSYGNIYVTDTRNHRVQVFDRQHKLKLIFNDQQRMLFPNGIAVTDSGELHRYRNDNFIIVIDSLNQRISKYSLTGELTAQTRMSQIGYSKAWLGYICIDYYNQLHITDMENHCLHKFDKNLNHIVSFGSFGHDDHQFDEPRGIAIYRRFGQLFIAERAGAQYYWIGTDISDLSVEEKESSCRISFRITEPSFISVDIFDQKGGLIKHLTERSFFAEAGSHVLIWNKKAGFYTDKFFHERPYSMSGLAAMGQVVPAGTYRLYLTAEATYSSRSYFIREIEKNIILTR